MTEAPDPGQNILPYLYKNVFWLFWFSKTTLAKVLCLPLFALCLGVSLWATPTLLVVELLMWAEKAGNKEQT